MKRGDRKRDERRAGSSQIAKEEENEMRKEWNDSMAEEGRLFLL
jgi:hypothetical protein